MALVIVGVAFVIGVVAASGPLFDASTGSAAFALEMSQECGPDLGTVASGYGPLDKLAQTNATLSALSSRLLRTSGAPADSLEPPVVTLNAADHGGANAESVRTGATGEHTQVGWRRSSAWRAGRPRSLDLDRPRSGGARPSRWPPLRRRSTRMSMASGKPPAEVRVAGTYRSLVGTVLPPFWCSLKGIFGSPDENAPPPPVILTTSPMFTRILRDAGVHTL